MERIWVLRRCIKDVGQGIRGVVFILGHIEFIAIVDLIMVVHGNKWGDVQTIGLCFWSKVLNHRGLLLKYVIVVIKETNNVFMNRRWLGCIVSTSLVVLVVLVDRRRKRSVQQMPKL